MNFIGRRPAANPFESLESRRLLSTSGGAALDPNVTNYNTHVTLQGTTGDDTIVVHDAGSTYAVKVNGTLIATLDKGVERLEIWAFPDGQSHADGDDLVDVSIVAAGTTVKVLGGSGDDVILGGYGDDLLYGMDGDDLITGNAGNDTIDGGFGIDEISGGSSGDDLLQNYSTSPEWVDVNGNGKPDGGDRRDVMHGLSGNDTIIGGDAYEVIAGGGQDDEIYAGPGHDEIFAGPGNDLVMADHDHTGRTGMYDRGNDTVLGHDGNDTLVGGRGVDWLLGQNGDDLLMAYGSYSNIYGYYNDADLAFNGGAGQDTLVYDLHDDPWQEDSGSSVDIETRIDGATYTPTY